MPGACPAAETLSSCPGPGSPQGRPHCGGLTPPALPLGPTSERPLPPDSVSADAGWGISAGDTPHQPGRVWGGGQGYAFGLEQPVREASCVGSPTSVLSSAPPLSTPGSAQEPRSLPTPRLEVPLRPPLPMGRSWPCLPTPWSPAAPGGWGWARPCRGPRRAWREARNLMPTFLPAPDSPHRARTRCPGPCSPVPAGAAAGPRGLAAMAPAHRDASSGDLQLREVSPAPHAVVLRRRR